MRLPSDASSAFGGTFLASGLGAVERVRQARLATRCARVARPGGAEDADVVLAVAVPIADDRLVALVAELGPQVVCVPLAVAVEVDEPLAVVEHADLGSGRRR